MTTADGVKSKEQLLNEVVALRRRVADMSAAQRRAAVAASHEAAPREAAETPVRRLPLRVLVADDHPLVRKGLVDLLREIPDIGEIVEARDGQEAVELAQQQQPDVVVMDITMPRLNGIEATRQICAESSRIRVIGLSMHEEADMARAMLEAGAAAYVRKDAPADALIEAVLQGPMSNAESSRPATD